MKKRLSELKHYIRLDNSNNALFLHISKTNHNFNFNVATMLAHIHNKRLRQIFEANNISLISSVNTPPGFFNVSLFFGRLVLNCDNI